MKLSDNTSISLPARNLLAILAAVAIGTMSYFSVIETDSGTDEIYKKDMINMLDEIVTKNY